MPGGANPPRQVAIAILVALAIETVDTGRTLEADRARQTGIVRNQRLRGTRTRKAEQTSFAARRIARRVVDTVDCDHSADRFRAPQGRLRPTHNFDSRRE